MFPADRFVDALLAAGIDCFTGVPCSLVAPVIAELERRGLYHGETREDAALGFAAGAYMAGKLPAVIMQNSGLGVSLNALGSLHLLYEMPCLILVTWRGFEGKDAPEHLKDHTVALNKMFASEDFKEGVRSFLEKRDPDWKAR